MKELKYLVIHCTATQEGRAISAQTVKDWHTKPAPYGRGWKRVGYSDLILIDGKRHQFVKHNNDIWVDANEITNGASGINSVSRHVCYVGGLDANLKPKNTITKEQSETLSVIIDEVLSYAPNILIAGHNQFSNKACPCFYVPKYLREVKKVPEKNIYNVNPYNYK